jgi:hypothetical protein
VDHRIGASDQPGEAFGMVERAFDPDDPLRFGLGAAGKGADFMLLSAGEADEMPADKAGSAGDRQFHSITI